MRVVAVRVVAVRVVAVRVVAVRVVKPSPLDGTWRTASRDGLAVDPAAVNEYTFDGDRFSAGVPGRGPHGIRGVVALDPAAGTFDLTFSTGREIKVRRGRFQASRDPQGATLKMSVGDERPGPIGLDPAASVTVLRRVDAAGP